MGVVATQTLVRGLRPYFWDTYNRMVKRISPMLSKLMDMSLVSDAYKESYAYFESAPYLERWDRGKAIAEDAFKAVGFSCVNLDWGISIPWHENDEQDDQTRSLVKRVSDAGESAPLLHEQVAFQLLLASTNSKLLPSVPNAPDGAALFATTAGGAARFGITNGNSLTSAGVSQTSQIIQNYYSAVAQFLQMQDTQGQPLWPAEIIRSGILCIHGAANEQVFEQAFEQKNIVSVVQNVAATENVAAAAPTNVIIDAARKVERWSTPRITDNSMYFLLTGTDKKPLFMQTRQPIRDWIQDMSNSDRARDTKTKRWHWEGRFGYGIALPYQVIKFS